MSSYSMLINGRSVTTSEQDDVINPARGEPFATCPRGTHGARRRRGARPPPSAYKTWKKDEAFRRAKLNECAAAIQARVQDIATVLSQEQGKPVTAAMAETFGASMWFSYYANLQIEPEVLQDDGEKRIEVVRKPLGVVAAITPWNFPVILLAWKLAPAWLAGNTVVAKPSPYTPLTSLMVADILKDVVPPGVLNVLSGGNELGAHARRPSQRAQDLLHRQRRDRQEDHGLRGRGPEARHARAGRQRPGHRARRRRSRMPSPRASSGARSRTPARCARRSSASTCTRRSTSPSCRASSSAPRRCASATAWIPRRSSARSTTRCSSSA